TGRPARRMPFLTRLAALAFLAFFVCEGSVYLANTGALRSGPLAPFARAFMRPVLVRYWPIRAWTLSHPALAVGGVLITLSLLTLAIRYFLLLWHNEVVARLSGTRFQAQQLGFPSTKFNLLRQIGQRPKGTCFVGMTPRRILGFRRWRPVYISQRQKTMHR